MPASSDQEALDSAVGAIERLRPWMRAGSQAPHKPLLLLIALRRVAEGRPRLVSFPEVEPELRELIGQFSNVESPANAGYPFWRLQTDGLWEVESANTFPTRASNNDPPLRSLRDRPARGGFPPQLYAALRAEPAELTRLVNLVAGRFFAPGDEVLRVVGMPAECGGGGGEHEKRLGRVASAEERDIEM